MDDLLAAFGRGEPRALARAITRCENGLGEALVRAVLPRSGRATTLGITGPPGVGKSTLTAALVTHLRALGASVGVIAVDPSSPFSRGALLGDRIRLAEHFTDSHVFIRSMASRGHLGGVAGATADTVTLMDAFGFDVVCIETVGVGQSEVEVAQIADTTVVVLQPGSGDSVQLLKAGILEVADVFVVNKRDHPAAPQLQREIRAMLEQLDHAAWRPPLVATQALDARGVDELWSAVLAHAAYLRDSGTLAAKRRAALAHRVRGLVLGALQPRIDHAVDALDGEPDPYAAARAIVAGFERGSECARSRLMGSAMSERVGFVGVGRMGANMARRLHERGTAVAAVYDVDRARARELAGELGTMAVETLAAVTAASDVVITVVTDDDAMRAIYASAGDSLLAGAAGKIFVNAATITPGVHVDVDERIEAAGARAIEACMASSIPQARNGELYLMCAGDASAYQAVQPLLAQMAASMRWIGGPGKAAEVKALVNMLMNINTAGLAEALGLGDALGLDVTMLREVFAQTGAASRVLETDGLDMQNREHDTYFSAAHAAKDSGIALQLAYDVGLDLPLAQATKDQYDLLVAEGLGDIDKSGIAELTFPDRRPVNLSDG